MALQGNPFLGKLKIPAPDLSHIPETPFESKTAKEIGSQSGLEVEPNLGQNSKKPTTKSQQTSNKPTTKLSQSEAKVEPQLKSKLSQSEAKVEPNPKKLSHDSIYTQPKVEPQLRPHHEPKLSQSEAKVEPNDSFSSLVGLQRDALRYIFDSCRFRGSKISGPIVIQNLAVALKSTPAAVRKAIQRLEQKGCIRRSGYKDGRGGWSEYQLTDDTYGALLLDESRAKVESNLGQSRAKVEPELEPQLRPTTSSSSSFLDLQISKTTTTGELELFENAATCLSPEWQSVDISPLSEIGFTQTHLTQIIRDGKLSSVNVQDSINFFAFDLRVNNKRKEINGNPLNYFMGILRKGTPYASPGNYESLQDQVIRKNLEAKRVQAEKRAAMESELKELTFEEWYLTLSEEEKLRHAPMLNREGPGQKAAVRPYFEENVWPERAQELLGLPKFERTEVAQLIDQSLRA